MELLKQAGVYDDTVIVISADHGENQGDLGIYGEHGTADRGTCRIPMIVRWPGMQAGQHDSALHYHLDWPPTCLELLGGEAEELTPEVWDGQSYAATLASGKPAGRDELILSQCAHVCQRSVRFDDDGHHWLYIRTYHDGLHPFPRHMLFDLATDPHEQTNVADQHPRVLRDAAWRLLDWHDRAMASVVRDCADVLDPMYTVLAEGGPCHGRPESTGEFGGFTAYLQRLHDTGRSLAAEDLAERYPGFL